MQEHGVGVFFAPLFLSDTSFSVKTLPRRSSSVGLSRAQPVSKPAKRPIETKCVTGERRSLGFDTPSATPPD
jgi:hypothetical protein